MTAGHRLLLHDGKARLYQGDCLAVLPTLADGSVDAVITDPPYSSGGMFRGDRTANTNAKYTNTGTMIDRLDFQGDNRDQRGWAYWSVMWLTELSRVARPGGPICMFTDWRQLPTATDILQASGWTWRGIIPWNKTDAATLSSWRRLEVSEYRQGLLFKGIEMASNHSGRPGFGNAGIGRNYV